MNRLSFLMLFIGILCAQVLFVACQPKMKAEEDCNFVMSSQVQRVSWKSTVPVTLYIHTSVPQEYRESIRVAASRWNYQLNKTFFIIQDASTSMSSVGVKDGVNIIYWKNEWESEKSSEQARTTIYWRGDQILEADMNINAKDNEYSAFGELAANKVDLTSLVLHELGHVMGMQHIQGEKSVMNPTLAYNTERLSPEMVDLNSLKCEYNL